MNFSGKKSDDLCSSTSVSKSTAAAVMLVKRTLYQKGSLGLAAPDIYTHMYIRIGELEFTVHFFHALRLSLFQLFTSGKVIFILSPVQVQMGVH